MTELRDPNKNILSVDYELKCQHPGCPGYAKIEHASTAGLKVGELVPFSPSVPEVGRCHRCKRHSMMVVKGPEPEPPAGTKGFPRGVPQE